MPTSLESNDSVILSEPFLPFISAAAIEYFETLLSPYSIVCEYGSGRSTIWLAQRAEHVTSVEHDHAWYDVVKKTIRELGLRNVDLHLISPPAQGDPTRAAEREYTEFLLRFPDGYFDLIFLDGWRPSRPTAAVFARDKAKPGGYIVIDNLEWSPVVNGIRHAGIESWEKKRLSGKTVGYIPGKTIGPLNCCCGFYQKPEVATDA